MSAVSSTPIVRSRPFAALVALAVALGGATLATPPARAAGPGLPPTMTAVELASSDLNDSTFLPSSAVDATIRWTLCGQDGRCDPSIPSRYELQVGLASSCGAHGACAWLGVPVRFEGPVNPADGRAGHGYWPVRTPSLDALIAGVALAGRTIGISARVRNANGWSDRTSRALTVATPLPNDRVPVALAPPQLASYGASMLEGLVVGARVATHAGSWQSGASPVYRLRAQLARCPDTACAVPEAQWTTPGWQCEMPVNGQYADLSSFACYVWQDIAAADIGFRSRVQARSLAGWSAWAYSPIGLLNPAPVPPPCLLCQPLGAIDLGGVVPLLPDVDLGALLRPTPARSPVLTAAGNPAAPVPAQSSVMAGSALGIVGTPWRLPPGWAAPDPLQATGFSLFACDTVAEASCRSVGSWLADGMIGDAPRVSSVGPVAPGTAYLRVGQTSELVTGAGIAAAYTALSDWVALVPTPVASDPAAVDGGSPSVDDVVPVGSPQVSPYATAAGVDQNRSPVTGVDGVATNAGATLRLRIPVIQKRGRVQRLRAWVSPVGRGTVRFVLVRLTPAGAYVVGKSRLAALHDGRARTRWTLARSKPAGAYVVVGTYTPRRAGRPGVSVTKAITVR